ncbi:hypothetical protein LTR95_015744 [Oleoguttula sp. CCFEE 5521]
MSRNYSVTEPHPSVSKSGSYIISSGIGGAGNYKRYNASELTAGPSATGPASLVALAKQPQRVVRTGRGGAGNFSRSTSATVEEPQRIFQFDEEMVKRRETQAPVYHIGRGGAANFVNDAKPRVARMGSTGSADSVSSGESAASSVRSAVGRLGRVLSSRS